MISEHQSSRLNGKWKYSGFLKLVISMPFIYGMIVPLLILDIGVSIYHAICFPLYGIPKVKRKEFINYERAKLFDLSWVDKFNCYYCSYANGLIAYTKKIAGETERVWCPIKHKMKEAFKELDHRKDFVDEGRRSLLEKYYKMYEEELKTRQ